MEILHSIGGLPRSGSTLLCNILNQNPKIHATSTSCLPIMVNNVIQATQSLEFKSQLDKYPGKTNERITNAIRALCFQWHSSHEKEIVFDKGRGWTNMPYAFRDISPNGKIIVCIRNLNAIFASVVKQDRKNGLLGGTEAIAEKAKDAFAPNGLIGAPLKGVVDMIQSQNENVVFLKYELFTADPKATMNAIYREVGLENFEHQFTDVKNTSDDCDGFYLNKFPHEGSGVVKPSIDNFKQIIPDNLQNEINEIGKIYNQAFGYV